MPCEEVVFANLDFSMSKNGTKLRNMKLSQIDLKLQDLLAEQTCMQNLESNDQ